MKNEIKERRKEEKSKRSVVGETRGFTLFGCNSSFLFWKEEKERGKGRGRSGKKKEGVEGERKRRERKGTVKKRGEV